MARPVDIARDQLTDYKWSGQFADGNEGTITILQNDGETFGHIELNERIFAVQSLGENSVLIEYERKTLAETSCGMNGNGDGNTSREPAGEENPFTLNANRANVRFYFYIQATLTMLLQVFQIRFIRRSLR